MPTKNVFSKIHDDCYTCNEINKYNYQHDPKIILNNWAMCCTTKNIQFQSLTLFGTNNTYKELPMCCKIEGLVRRLGFAFLLPFMMTKHTDHMHKKDIWNWLVKTCDMYQDYEGWRTYRLHNGSSPRWHNSWQFLRLQRLNVSQTSCRLTKQLSNSITKQLSN